MSDTPHPAGPEGWSGPQWPMAPGVPGSPQAREARTIVGLAPDASDSEFVGASPSEGRDALVLAARRRLEPVLAAHGLHSRESWLVDHELKSALGRLLAGRSPPAQGPRAPAPASPHAPPAPAPRAPATAASPQPAPRPAQAPALAGLAVAQALYARRARVGRALLAMSMRAPQAVDAGSDVQAGKAKVAHAEPDRGDGEHGFAARAQVHNRGRSRARIIAATIAVLSAIGLVIEVAYVPVHLRRSRAAQDAAVSSAPAVTSDPARAPSPSPQPGLSDATVATPRAAPAQGQVPAAPEPSRAPDRTAAAPRTVPIPSPALPPDRTTSTTPQSPSPTADPVDPTTRQQLDALAAAWGERVSASIDAGRTIASVEEGPMQWLAKARLLERLIALDDIAQLLIDARAEDAQPLVDVMPVTCDLAAIPVTREGETSVREDGRLVTDLSRAGGGGESRLAVLRAYRSLPLAPGRADARALVSEAIGGPSRNSRALALAILLERGGDSVAVLEAVHARFNDLTATPAARAVVEQLAGELPGGAPIDAQSLRARLARRILEGRGAPMHLIDATADATAAMLDRMARRADPQVAPADMESSLATLARAASRDAAPARLDGARGPLQRMVASLTALEGARIVRNYRRLPDERARVDAAASASAARVGAAQGSLDQAIEVALGILAQDGIALRVPGPAVSSEVTFAAAGADQLTANPLLLPEPPADSLARWPDAARALSIEDGEPIDADALIRIAEDVQDASAGDEARAVAARLYARAAIAGTESAAASAARGIASLIADGRAASASERHRWESIAAQYAIADAAMRGRSAVQRRSGTSAGTDAEASSRTALADALALAVAGYGRQSQDRLQSPTVRALAHRLASALPGGIDGFEALLEGRTPGSPPLDPAVASQLLAIEAALRDPRSTRWSDDLALRKGLPLVSVDTASRAARASIFRPGPAPGPQ